MRNSALFRPLLAAALGLASMTAASAQGLFDTPFFGGGYAPAPSYSYGGYGSSWREGAGVGGGVAIGGIGVSAGVGVGAVRYDQGYYYGGYQYPAGGYGGGDYRRAAYTAADVYVGPRPVYARPYYPPAPRPIYRPYGGYYNAAAYRPYGGPVRQCRCASLY